MPTADAGTPAVPSGSSPQGGPLADQRLQTLNDTIDRMGRQLRGVVKVLNQQQEQVANRSPASAPNENQLLELGENVDRMGRELRGVLNLLIQQQATLARLTHGQASPPLPAVAPPAGTGFHRSMGSAE